MINWGITVLWLLLNKLLEIFCWYNVGTKKWNHYALCGVVTKLRKVVAEHVYSIVAY